MQLNLIARRPTSGATAGKHERTAHAVVLNVGQIGQPFELGDAGRPQVVRALDYICHVGRHLVGVFLGQQQQVRPHGLVDGILDRAVNVQGHQLDGLGADAGLHPGAHLGRPHAGDGAVGHVMHDLLDFNQFGLGIGHGGAAQRGVT